MNFQVTDLDGRAIRRLHGVNFVPHIRFFWDLLRSQFRSSLFLFRGDVTFFVLRHLLLAVGVITGFFRGNDFTHLLLFGRDRSTLFCLYSEGFFDDLRLTLSFYFYLIGGLFERKL